MEEPSRSVGRYFLFAKIAAGGMATVHLGRLEGAVGFARTVAIKRLHPHCASDPEFVAMLLDEARLAARVQHPNVVAMLDVVAVPGEILLVMEYIHGESLGRLVRAASTTGAQIDPRLGATVLAGVLHGLHAAHEAKREDGDPLGIVHRDVSPQNVLVGVDGVPRVLDFGIAKAVGRIQTTGDAVLKGKLRYIAPEHFLQKEATSRRTDIYGAAVVLWEVLTGRRLFTGDSDAAIVESVLHSTVAPPSQFAPSVPPALDAITLRGLARDPSQRYATALEMALELERCSGIVSPFEIGRWVESLASEELSRRAALVAEMEARLTAYSTTERRMTASAIARAHEDGPTRVEDPRLYSGPLSSSVRDPRLYSGPLSSSVRDARGNAGDAGLSTPGTHAPFEVPTRAVAHAGSFDAGDDSHRATVVQGDSASVARGRRWRRALALVAVVGAGGTLAVGMAWKGSRTPAPSLAAASSEALLSPAASATGVDWAASANVPALPPLQSSPSVAPPSTPPGSGTLPPPSGRHRKWRLPPAEPPPSAVPTAAPQAAPSVDPCSPPYTLDAKNHRHYKPACL
jgi:serine/threonine-protein kinase